MIACSSSLLLPLVLPGYHFPSTLWPADERICWEALFYVQGGASQQVFGCKLEKGAAPGLTKAAGAQLGQRCPWASSPHSPPGLGALLSLPAEPGVPMPLFLKQTWGGGVLCTRDSSPRVGLFMCSSPRYVFIPKCMFLSTEGALLRPRTEGLTPETSSYILR